MERKTNRQELERRNKGERMHKSEPNELRIRNVLRSGMKEVRIGIVHPLVGSYK